MSLLHFSLAAGFASPRLTGVLKATNYLVPAERQGLDEERQEAIQRKEKSEKEKKKDAEEGEKTWRRLMETTRKSSHGRTKPTADFRVHTDALDRSTSLLI
jgi:hypothetical protein